MRRIILEEVEHVAFRVAQEVLFWNEPIPDFRTRFPHRLESCLMTPFQSFEKKDLYKTFINKAAILFYLMNKNHPFQNGNKRVAVITLFYFLKVNDKWLNVSTNDLYEAACSVASSSRTAKDITLLFIEKFLEKHIIPWED